MQLSKITSDTAADLQSREAIAAGRATWRRRGTHCLRKPENSLSKKTRHPSVRLQRWFKVGFNRAARIMDQLSEAGVVGEEAGTKPREILMTLEEFERYLEEYV